MEKDAALTGSLSSTAYFLLFFLGTEQGLSARSLRRSMRATWPWLGVLTNSWTQLGGEETHKNTRNGHIQLRGHKLRVPCINGSMCVYKLHI